MNRNKYHWMNFLEIKDSKATIVKATKCYDCQKSKIITFSLNSNRTKVYLTNKATCRNRQITRDQPTDFRDHLSSGVLYFSKLAPAAGHRSLHSASHSELHCKISPSILHYSTVLRSGVIRGIFMAEISVFWQFVFRESRSGKRSGRR